MSTSNVNVFRAFKATIDQLQAMHAAVSLRPREISMRAAFEGEVLTGRTWVGEAPKGARFDRHMEFIGEDGKIRVRAVTQWAIIDKASGRPIRVPPEVIAPFTGN